MTVEAELDVIVIVDVAVIAGGVEVIGIVRVWTSMDVV